MEPRYTPQGEMIREEVLGEASYLASSCFSVRSGKVLLSAKQGTGSCMS